MTRTILVLLVCSVLTCAQSAPTSVTGSYKFTTPQTTQSMEEIAKLLRSVASVPQVTIDPSTAALIFTGTAEAVNFAAWILPEIDKTAGASAVHEYRFPSGDIGRVTFLSNPGTPQSTQELMTIVRTVADVGKISTLSTNHAIVMRSHDWGIAFAAWIVGQIDRPADQKPNPTPREFTVGGPDFRGLGHGARVVDLVSPISQKRMQQVLTVLRAVGDVQKVFDFSSTRTLVFRAGDTDLQRALWLIQQLDSPTGHAPGTTTFTAPDADDATREFHLGDTAENWVESAVTSLRADLKTKHIFYTTAPANIVVRGTADQIAAATAWMTSHNALLE